jgi:hypothetical protein
MNPSKLITKLAIVFAIGASLTACSDDDDKDEINFAPSAESLNLMTETEVSIADTLSASDPENDTLSFALDQQPTLGSVSLSSTGAFSYQPFDELTGNDSFTFIVSDIAGNTNTGIVNIEIVALEVSFIQFTRDAFMADENSKPASINGKTFIQDSTVHADFQDLLDNN